MFGAHQACRHPGVPTAEPGLPAEVLTQRETTHTAVAATQTLCRGDTHIKPEQIQKRGTWCFGFLVETQSRKNPLSYFSNQKPSAKERNLLGAFLHQESSLAR